MEKVNIADDRYWDLRSETYSKLDDIKSKRTSYKLVNFMKEFSPNLGVRIVDLGCAMGLMTRVVRDNFRHSEVVGVDLSGEMVSKARLLERDGLSFIVDNVKRFSSLNHNPRFDFSIMSLVLHHLIGGDDYSVLCNVRKNLLSDSGRIIIAEAVPPSEEIFDYYSYIFSIKENRNCYREKDLVSLLYSAGFTSVVSTSYRFHIRLKSWLNDKTLSRRTQRILYDLHISAPEEFKRAYNMTHIGNNDYSLSCKMVLVSGKKD